MHIWRFVAYITNGFIQGFKVGFDTSKVKLHSQGKNLRSTAENTDVVTDYIGTELTLKRLLPIKQLVHISPIGIIPKKHQPGKWHLIIDLSVPKSASVNDSINPDICSLSYSHVDRAASFILELGRGAMLAKLDIKSAYRLVPVHPSDRYLLGLQWEGETFVDTCLPFGLRSTPKIFNAVADTLLWIMRSKGVHPAIHYLDNYLFFGPPLSTQCANNLHTALSICESLGIPVAPDKVVGPATSLTYLGLELDSSMNEIHLPQDKLLRLRETVAAWLRHKACTKRELLTLIGQHV